MLVAVFSNRTEWVMCVGQKLMEDVVAPSDPHELAEYTGLIPSMFSNDMSLLSMQEIKDQLEGQYGSLYNMSGTIKDNVYQSKGDPDLYPVAYSFIGKYTVFIYLYGIVGIVDRLSNEQFITRMD